MKFDEDRPITGEMLLEGAYILEPLLPDTAARQRARQAFALEKLALDPDYQHFLVIGPVEDPDVPAPRQPGRAPPQEIVVEVLRARCLERMHFAPLRIDPRHHVLDRAVLAARVHRLEDREHRPAVIG